VVCSNFGIWLKEDSVIAASASADSETNYITDFICPWTCGFALLQSSQVSFQSKAVAAFCVMCSGGSSLSGRVERAGS